MQVKVIFDKCTQDKNLHTGWGISFLIDERVLFDTGNDGHQMVENMKRLKVKLDRLEAVVISHDHWDHTGGLWELLSIQNKTTVYACPHFARGFKENVHKLSARIIDEREPVKIGKDIYTSGEIDGEYGGLYLPEQALVIKTDNGVSVFTGCAHPGIVKILKKIKEHFSNEDFYLVCGGFHLMDSSKKMIKYVIDEFKRMNVNKVGATHCTGEEAEAAFRREYKDRFIRVAVGERITV